MTGKQVKQKQINRLRLSRGHDGIWRVRSPDPPHKVLFKNTDQNIAYRWAHRCRKFARKEPIWAQHELEYLSENYGLLPAEEIAHRLRRTKNALKLISFRKLRINQSSNLYTARAVAVELGIGWAKTIISWKERGYLKGKQAPWRCGKSRVYHFEYEDIEECIQQRPWLVKPMSMPESFFRAIAREEWVKDPWYNCKEASTFLGHTDPQSNALKRYIRRGWVPAVRQPGAGGLGEYVIRKSAIDAFLQNDPRPELYHTHRTAAARNRKRRALIAQY